MLKKDLQNALSLFSNELSGLGRRLITKGNYRLSLLKNNMRYELRAGLQTNKHRMEIAGNTLEDLSPMHLLDKGYSIITKKGVAISSISSINQADEVKFVLKDGSAKAKVTSVKPGNIR